MGYNPTTADGRWGLALEMRGVAGCGAMTFEAFCELREEEAAALSAALQALWWERRGNWDAAHAKSQEEGDRDGDWVHAYLHRKEGDEGNARYWYGRAGRVMPAVALKEEWEQIARELLAR